MVSTEFGDAGIWIMIAAVVISIAAMMLFAGPIGAFVQRHPTVKMPEGFHQKIPKGYIYFAMAFSIIVELLNMRLRKKSEPVHLHNAFSDADEAKVISGA
jgi:predicted tellurium resistance membrane protein TerC